MKLATFWMVTATATLAACISHGGPAEASADAPEPAAKIPPDPALLAKGAELYEANCAMCHAIGSGGASITGPNLHGVVGTVSGTHTDFPYSDALIAAQVVWTDETLDLWLTKPSEYIEGNIMGFMGFADPTDRAAVIAYLNENS